MDFCDCILLRRRHDAVIRVMTGIRQLVSLYLALCLVLAGAVGLSPSLHRLIEHGGKGGAHVHGRQELHSSTAPHHHNEAPAHSHPPALTTSVGAGHLLVHAESAFPSTDVLLARLWHGLQHLFDAERYFHDHESNGEDADHHHDSLAGLLAGGLIDHVDPSADSLVSAPLTDVQVLPLISRLPFFDWNAQATTRGPPSCQG